MGIEPLKTIVEFWNAGKLSVQQIISKMLLHLILNETEHRQIFRRLDHLESDVSHLNGKG